MRQFMMFTLVAVAASLVPTMVRADGSNQESAQRISDRISSSGQLSAGEKVAVRYLNGTVWLQGHVRDQETVDKTVAAVFGTEGVVINQVIRDELICGSTKPAGAPASVAVTAVANPLRGSAGDVNHAQALPASFNPSHAALPVAMMQPVPVPAPVPTPLPPVPAPTKLPAADSTSGVPGAPLPMYAPGAAAGGPAPVRYDRPAMPCYAWPSYAAYPNYAAVTYPKQYSPTAWPYIGPFYPYPQVPLGWRKVSLEWDDGWWWLDFKDKPRCCWWR